MAGYEIWIPAIHNREECFQGAGDHSDSEILDNIISQLWGNSTLRDYTVHIRRKGKKVARYQVIIDVDKRKLT